MVDLEHGTCILGDQCGNLETLRTRSLPPSDEDWGKVLSRAIHEHLCRRDIMQYLDNEEDCAGLAQAALTALAPLIAKLREEVLEEERATVLAWLRAEAQLCDCHAREPSECACGAWDDNKTVQIATIIEGIQALSPDGERME